MASPSQLSNSCRCRPPLTSPSLHITPDSSETCQSQHMKSRNSSIESLGHSPPSVPKGEQVDSNEGVIQKHQRPDPFDTPDNTRTSSINSSQESLKPTSTQFYASMVEKNAGTKSGNTVSTHSVSAVPLPNTRWTHRQWIKVLSLHWLSAYRVLIGLTFIINVVVFAVLYKRLSLAAPLIATAANIFAAVFVRQEDLINLTFSLVAKMPSNLPLWCARTISDLHHYGGFHIGCAISALLWYTYFVYRNTISFLDNEDAGTTTASMWVDIITCYSFLFAIFLVCVTAHPRLRVKFHNTFEHTHRFGGWTALIVLWIHAGVSSKSPENPNMYANAAVWLLAATTFIIILPWTRMRRVPITTELVSNREVKLSFPFKHMPYTSTMRFSQSPLLEWHAFATIPNPDGESAYIVISQAGDWTKAMIQNPPSHIWIRKPAAMNFLAFSPLFNSLLLVATGAGIGPMLSLLRSPAIAKMKKQGRMIKVMWCVYQPDAPHWQFVQDIIRNVDPEPRIFDSKQGRPDVAGETTYLMKEARIETVMVVSNPKVTREVVEGVKAWGGAAYGAVFDS
ncbi:hypothetical protein COCMIDRAFT_102752 [Bipolaris oryzae ATCC 44560]|uniref:FAD-binding FR-type domain-containing protein n=1 Tax=Bipolaris oryzae ATCC 44560 TaxID=930090 RepID=W6Z592_COCMI|nr:uncharacterized protein COCMIDRAFT_102752 [Bipolaris oryzae ATCC 44560]EUC42729.1 hypothetical protein COCMIDRAFT_102752 [Bipolaris oryzae ATCC 44560]